jgi:penicillin-binding protein 1B
MPRWRPLRYALLALVVLALAGAAVLSYFWIHYGRMLESRLAGEQRPMPRIFGRPFELHAGEGLSPDQLVEQLNDIGYAGRTQAEQPGEFSVDGTVVTIVPREPGERETPQPVRVEFSKGAAPIVSRIAPARASARTRLDSLTLEPPLLAALAPGERRRHVPLASIPRHVVQAVLAIEDRRFYDHPGIDPIRIGGAIITNLFGDKPYLEGGSTITQQLSRNFFLTDEMAIEQQTGRRSPIRKLREQFMSIVLETRISKDQILELYLNDVVLGRRGPFDIHGVSEASRIFFGKDVRNVTLAEAATMAGVIQSPSRLSPFRNPERARERRNVVLREMAANGFAQPDDAERAAREPLRVSSRAIENEAPYFVDYVSQLVGEQHAGLLAQQDAAVDVYTTLDVHLQRVAQEVVAQGIAQVDKQLAARKRPGTAQAALVAIDPRTGEVLALVGGRSYSQSQFNRAVSARRQPGSVFKPFVYLAAFEQMIEQQRTDITPATLVADEPTIFKDGENDYAPANYQNEYDGPITLRRALALSRNIVAIKVAEQIGYDKVAALWKRFELGTTPRPFPSIALGVFEVTPLEMASAYTVFANGGTIRPLMTLTRFVEGGRSRTVPPPRSRRVARAETTFLVTNMMRSVLNEGTGASARSAGFSLDAAGKSGTTNDLRDAWFIGLTPELLTVVWVGFDDNKPIGLSGSQAALPMWTAFMKRALAGRASREFTAPDEVEFAEIDKDTGQLATPDCPKTLREAFLPGTAPTETCETHGHRGLGSFLSGVGGFFRRLTD